MHPKLFQNEQRRKQEKQLVIYYEIRLHAKLQKLQVSKKSK